MKQAYSTDDAPKAPAILSQAISSNGFIFVAGQVHCSPNGKLIDGTTEEKLDHIMKNIKAILKSAGANLNDIVKTTIYVTDMAQMPKLNEDYPTYFEGPLPAREAICVKELPLGATLEISVIAATN